MPLRAIKPDGTDTLSFLISDKEWEAIRLSKGKHGLTMPDGAPAVAKVSSQGTRFFAHKAGHGTATAPESKEHLLAKIIIAKSAYMAGWKVKTEAEGIAPSGNPWRADVLCERGNGKIAFEVQWSRQTPEEMRRRQAIYRSSGVRCMWLVRSFNRSSFVTLPSNQNCPAFEIQAATEGENFNIVLPTIGREKLTITLSDFIAGSLLGRLTWWSYEHWQQSDTLPFEIKGAETLCWKCHKWITFLYHLLRVDNGEPIDFDRLARLRALNQEIERLSFSHPATRPEVTSFSVRHSRTHGRKKAPGVCPHCKASLDPGLKWGMIPDGRKAYRAVIHLPAEDAFRIPFGTGVWTWNERKMPRQTSLIRVKSE